MIKRLYIISVYTVIILSFSCQQIDNKNLISREIDASWTFNDTDGEYSGKATIPGTIHTDLLDNKIIKDPFYRLNERGQQWIDKKNWEYHTILNINEEEFNKSNLVLFFEGLDTYADVFINDSLVLSANNMFRQWEVNLKPIVNLGDNTLKVLLHSPIKKGLELLENHYALPAINDQSKIGEMEEKKVSIFTRKAGYHYGWDWGPRLVTSGIWRPIVLKAWNALRVIDVFIKQPKVTKEKAVLVCDVSLELDAAFSGEIKVSDSDTETVYKQSNFNFVAGKQTISLPFSIQNPKLWWSRGLGKPNMYDFTISVLDEDGHQLSTRTISTGLRSIKLVREKDSIGESFLFEINGIRTFIKGANYIPNDNFLPRVTQSDYEKVIKDAVDANMNMLRVWGGGIYENDIFYKLCNENGLMVWQDFMFACSMYPGDAAFLENVKQEAVDNVIRLRNHPSIAVWCGNNEINMAWSHYSEGGWGWKEKYSAAQRDEIQKAYLDIFHDILPSVVGSYSESDYWPSSPQAGIEPEKHAGYETTAGDMHYWGVWHGQHPFEDFEKYKARFMSEYGFQSFPDFETVKKYAIEEDFDIESDVMASHQRSGIGNLRIKEYMDWDYNMPSNFEDFLYMSQVLQAKGVKMAIEAHRRAMPYCMGTMYWQINDCWPVASWSSTDYYHKWKALHYKVKKAYEPILLTIHKENKNIVIHGVSDELKNNKGTLQLTILDFSGKVISQIKEICTIRANTSTEIFEAKTEKLISNANPEKLVLKVEFLDEEKTKVLAENLFYFEKPKSLQLEEPYIKTKIIKEGGKTYLKMTSDKLVKDLYIKFAGRNVFLSDNYFDVLPNRPVTIELTNDGDINIETLELKHLYSVQSYNKKNSNSYIEFF